MAIFKFWWSKMFLPFVYYLLWTILRCIAKNTFQLLRWAYNILDSLDGDAPDFIELRQKVVSTTPTVHKKKTPGKVKETLSSIKRNNKRTTDADFQGRARRELFKTSPGKFLLDNERFSRLPKKPRPNYEPVSLRQNRPRI